MEAAEQIASLIMPASDGRICTYRQGRCGLEPHWLSREEFVEKVRQILDGRKSGAEPGWLPDDELTREWQRNIAQANSEPLPDGYGPNRDIEITDMIDAGEFRRRFLRPGRSVYIVAI